MTLFNSIVAGNAPDNITGSYTNTGVNFTNGNPQLQTLGNYGGPTLTMPPVYWSPVIQAGADSAGSLFATDQRGAPRISGIHPDIGAVEAQLITASLPPQLPSSIWQHGTVRFNFTNTPGTHFTVLWTTNINMPLPAWTVAGVAMETPANSGQFAFTNTPGTPQGFFRVRSP